MGLSRALVDRARIYGKSSTGQKVDGRVVMRDTQGAWFRVRLTLPQTDESTAAGRTRVSRRPELLYALRDAAGGPVTLHADQTLEVDSADTGRSFWEVDGEPELMRRRKGLVGGLAYLSRVEEPGAD